METVIYHCPICGNVIVKLNDSGVTPFCCGESMETLTANTSEGMGEKHVPVVNKDEDGKVTIKVGSIAHPMESGHYIKFLLIITRDRMCRCGWTYVRLFPGNLPQYTFIPYEAEVVAVYAFCNIHNLWKSECAQPDSCKVR